MYKTCSKCGKIHTKGFICAQGKRIYRGGTERKLRATNKWKQKSIEIRERAHYLCEVCKANGVINYDGVEVHHIIKLKDDESLLLDDFNLICLCTAHHKEADEGKIDREYLQEIAQRRELLS